MRLLAATCAVAAAVAAVPAAGSDPPPAPPTLLVDQEVSRYTLHTERDCGTPPGRSCVQRDTEVEPSIAVNPEDPLNAVAVFQQGRVGEAGAAAIGFATTFDGGTTWRSGSLPGATQATGGRFRRATDPAVAFGPGGIVYANTLAFDGYPVLPARSTSLQVHISRDGGATWALTEARVSDDSIGGSDKNWIAVDTGTGPGHRTGRVYVAWGRFFQIGVAYSDDEGASWHVQHFGWQAPAAGTVGVVPVVLRGGDLGLLVNTLTSGLPASRDDLLRAFEEPLVAEGEMRFTVARGAGSVPTGGPLLFDPPVKVAAWAPGSIEGLRAGPHLPAVTMDPASGALYAVWSDGRFRTDERFDAAITASYNGGRTWTVPARVNPGPRDDRVNRWGATVGVGPGGWVAVGYRLRRESDGPLEGFDRRVDTMLQVSTDGALTFSEPVRVNTVEGDVGFAARSDDSVFLGDYDQIGVGGDRIYMVRAEAVRTSEDELSWLPPYYQHQRTWVAVATMEA